MGLRLPVLGTVSLWGLPVLLNPGTPKPLAHSPAGPSVPTRQSSSSTPGKTEQFFGKLHPHPPTPPLRLDTQELGVRVGEKLQPEAVVFGPLRLTLILGLLHLRILGSQTKSKPVLKSPSRPPNGILGTFVCFCTFY